MVSPPIHNTTYPNLNFNVTEMSGNRTFLILWDPSIYSYNKPTHYNLSVSIDGEYWTKIAENLYTTSFIWDCRLIKGGNYFLKLEIIVNNELIKTINYIEKLEVNGSLPTTSTSNHVSISSTTTTEITNISSSAIITETIKLTSGFYLFTVIFVFISNSIRKKKQ